MSGDRRRSLSLFDLTCIGVNAIVGSSIFLIPGRLAAQLGPASVLAFAATGGLLSCVALCFAEAGGRFEGHGGPYLYAREAFGGHAGFAIGWLCWLTEVVSWAAVAVGIAPYLAFFFPVLDRPLGGKLLAAGVIAVLAAVNRRGVKPGAWTADALTLSKLVPLGLLVACGLPYVREGRLAPFAPHGLKPLGAACLMAYFALQGFEVVPVPAGESARPTRDVPLAVLLSIGFSTLFYILIQISAVAVDPGLAASTRPLAEAASIAIGPWGAALMAAGAAISMIGFNAGCALGGPRYLAALGEHGDLPARVGERHPRFGTPSFAITLTAVLSMLLALRLDFDRLVDVVDVVIGAQYVSTCLAVLVLRHRTGPSRGFQAPGGAAVPLVGIGAAVWLGSQVAGADLAWAGLLLLAGFALRFMSDRTWKSPRDQNHARADLRPPA